MGRARWGALVVVAAVAAGGGSATAQTIPSIDLGGDMVKACGAAFGAGAFAGFLPKGEAAAGEPVSVTLSWRKASLAADTVDILNCVSLDGAVVGDLSTVDRGVPNRGSHRFAFTLPTDAPRGAKVCERSAVLGPEGDAGRAAERLGATCFTVAAAGGTTAVSGAKGPEAPLPSSQPDTSPRPAPASPGRAPVAGPAAPVVPPAAAEAPAPEAAPADPGEAVVAGKTENRAAAADASPALARTGLGSRMLMAAAGLLLVLGGLTVALSPGRRHATTPS